MPESYDVILIGGGIMGCCTAFELAQRGVNVAVFDKMSIGEGPTGHSSAIVRQHYSNELTARMAHYSLGVFRDFSEQVGGECGFENTGFVVLVDAKDQAGLEANIALQRSVGIKTESLSPEALHELMPGLAVGDLVAAAYEPDSGYADPYLTVNAYAQAARRHGAAIQTNTEVTGIRFDGDKVSGVDTANGQFDAPVVVNTGGPWGAQIAAMAGVDAPINPCRVQVSLFKRPPGEPPTHPVVIDFIQAAYFRPETGNLTLVGLVDPAEADAIVDPDRFNENVDFDFVVDTGDRLVTRYPAMERSESAGGFASLYAITPDWHPIIDEAPAGSGCFLCTGFSGHGFKLGPAVGRMMADRILQVSDPLFDTQPFRLSRYAENAQVSGQYEYSIVG
jgi:sarcosine oxidase subunit beta